MTVLQAAKDYHRRGLVPIPVGRDKKPLVPWKEFQSRRPTVAEIEGWFKGDAQIGIVTGKLSNLSVIDIDSEQGEKNIEALIGGIGVAFRGPVVLTPRGGKHLYCQYHAGFGNNVRAIEGVDLRSEGGFIVCPPSSNGQGKPWAWLTGLDAEIPPLPPAYAKAIVDNVIAPGSRSWSWKPGEIFTEGRRNNDLFHVLYHMAKGGERGKDLDGVGQAIGGLVSLPKDEVGNVLASVRERVGRGERNLSKDIGDWVNLTEGVFNLTELRKDLQIITSTDRANLSVVIHRLKDQGVIESGGRKNGEYRRIVRDCERVDWINAPTDPIPFKWPFGLEDLANIYPKSIVVIAGQSNAGKTSFLLDFVKRNQWAFDIHYFSNEMGGSEAKVRLLKHEDITLNEWKFNLWDRTDHFGDVIIPDGVNIIDYLEEKDGEAFKIPSYISQVWNKLDKGIAIIAIQKKGGRDTGVGGEGTLAKSRLYLAMEFGIIKIVKAKAWAGARNPNGMTKKFRLIQGWKYIEDSDWLTPEQVEMGAIPTKAEKEAAKVQEKRRPF